MKTLAISGSSRKISSTRALLNYLNRTYPQLNIIQDEHLHYLPLFHSALNLNNPVKELTEFKKNIDQADRLIICTPEYLHNLPAAIKNAFEWCTESGEFTHKKILPICYTPRSPRGEKAMQSLLWSLDALNALVPASLLIHHTEISFDQNGKIVKNEIEELLDGSIELLVA